MSAIGFFFLLRFFWCGQFLKSLLNLLQYCFCFMFWFFGRQACNILTPWPGIKPTPPALEDKVLTTGPPGKSHSYRFLMIFFIKLRKFLSIPESLLRVSNMNWCWILSNTFLAPINMNIWFFSLSCWYGELIDFWMLNHPCLHGIHSNWLWCIILLYSLFDLICYLKK